MAACTLKIVIDDPTRTRVGGETVTGHVLVQAEKDVNCKGLEVTSCWMTHGRGNVARGDAESQTLYQGPWNGGQEYRYPFKLTTAQWPPTYYGNYLNVGHYIEARAKLPWAIDPKTQEEITVVASQTPEGLAPVNIHAKKSGLVGWVAGTLIVGALLMLMIPVVLIAVPFFGVIGGLFWFFRVFLPKQITGPVDLVVEPASASPGEVVGGHFEFMPKWNTPINGITWTVRCIERCISGSGSNRTTHTHEVLSRTYTLAEAGSLVAGEKHRHELGFTIPATAPPSLKLTDNEVIWSSEMRIDIPRWPDWVQQKPFVVKVPGASAGLTQASYPSPGSYDAPGVIMAKLSGEDDDPWLTEVFQQILQCEEDSERLDVVIDALAGQEFAITVDTQGIVDEPYDAEIESEGSWIGAVDKARGVPLVLFVPINLDSSVMQWLTDWQGVATIHGLDTDTRRIIMQVQRPL
jgi:hypothetical protein